MPLILKNSQNKQCINNFLKINNSNPINPLIHHWPKTFSIFSAKSKFKKSKIRNSKVQKISNPKSNKIWV
jgi:hypothetical protein